MPKESSVRTYTVYGLLLWYDQIQSCCLTYQASTFWIFMKRGKRTSRCRRGSRKASPNITCHMYMANLQRYRGRNTQDHPKTLLVLRLLETNTFAAKQMLSPPSLIQCSGGSIHTWHQPIPDLLSSVKWSICSSWRVPSAAFCNFVLGPYGSKKLINVESVEHVDSYLWLRKQSISMHLHAKLSRGTAQVCVPTWARHLNVSQVGPFISKATSLPESLLFVTLQKYMQCNPGVRVSQLLCQILRNFSGLRWVLAQCFYKIDWRCWKQAEGSFRCAHHAAMSRHCACRHSSRLLGSQRIMTFKIIGSEVPTNLETHPGIPGHNSPARDPARFAGQVTHPTSAQHLGKGKSWIICKFLWPNDSLRNLPSISSRVFYCRLLKNQVFHFMKKWFQNMI